MIGKHQIEHNGPARRGVGAARATVAAVAIALIAMTATTVSAQVVYETIYITNNTHDNIQRVNLTGFADVTDLGVPAPGSFGIALDAAGGKMYWTDLSDDVVRRSNLDGTNVEELVSLSTGANPRNIVLDLDSSPNKMYWTDAGQDVIRRANLDGSNVEDLIFGVGGYGIGLDVAGGVMYNCDRENDTISRANLDGTGIVDLVTFTSGGYDLALDLESVPAKLYVSGPEIIRMNLDGSSMETVVAAGDVGQAHGLALDLDNGHIYWTEITGAGGIGRADLDGTNVQFDIFGIGAPEGIALLRCFDNGDCDNDSILDGSDNCITVSNLGQDDLGDGDVCDDSDGDGVFDFEDNCVDTFNDDQADDDGDGIGEVCDPCPGDFINDPDGDGVCANDDLCPSSFDPLQADSDFDGIGDACDPCVNSTTDDRIYWIDESMQTIGRGDLNNPACIDLALNSGRGYGIALDVDAGFIYWTDWSQDTIKRSKLNGNDVQILLEDLDNPYGIALDLVNGKMYWTQDLLNFNSIWRADLDGSNAEELIPTAADALDRSRGIAVDPTGGKIYWGDWGASVEGIMQADLDGSNPTLLWGGADFPGPIGFDVERPENIVFDDTTQKLYWADRNAGLIVRANADGTGAVEVLVDLSSSFGSPIGLALDVENDRMYWTNGRIYSATLNGDDIQEWGGTNGLDSLALYQLPRVLGDCDLSGVVDMDDLPCFVESLVQGSLSDPRSYVRCDMNSSGYADGRDIAPFISALFGEPITGACCEAGGVCSVIEEANCDGVYQGDYTTCFDAVCPVDSGACCYYLGGCTEVVAANCVGGVFNGAGSMCESGCPMLPTPTLTSAMFDMASTSNCPETVVQVDITGTEFLDGATAYLVQTGQPDFAAQSTTVVNATTIEATFELSLSIAAGDWNVVVCNPDLQTSNADTETLTITACPAGACCLISFLINGKSYIPQFEVPSSIRKINRLDVLLSVVGIRCPLIPRAVCSPRLHYPIFRISDFSAIPQWWL